jgi:hypothetical protein
MIIQSNFYINYKLPKDHEGVSLDPHHPQKKLANHRPQKDSSESAISEVFR